MFRERPPLPATVGYGAGARRCRRGPPRPWRRGPPSPAESGGREGRGRRGRLRRTGRLPRARGREPASEPRGRAASKPPRGREPLRSSPEDTSRAASDEPSRFEKADEPSRFGTPADGAEPLRSPRALRVVPNSFRAARAPGASAPCAVTADWPSSPKAASAMGPASQPFDAAQRTSAVRASPRFAGAGHGSAVTGSAASALSKPSRSPATASSSAESHAGVPHAASTAWSSSGGGGGGLLAFFLRPMLFARAAIRGRGARPLSRGAGSRARISATGPLARRTNARAAAVRRSAAAALRGALPAARGRRATVARRTGGASLELAGARSAASPLCVSCARRGVEDAADRAARQSTDSARRSPRAASNSSLYVRSRTAPALDACQRRQRARLVDATTVRACPPRNSPGGPKRHLRDTSAAGG